jgi:hypothetical protein
MFTQTNAGLSLLIAVVISEEVSTSGIASNQRQQTANACVKGPCCFASTYLEKSSSLALAGSILSARFSHQTETEGGTIPCTQ